MRKVLFILPRMWLGQYEYYPIETATSSKNAAKRLKLSLSKEKSRFAPPVSEEKMIDFAKGKKCVNTDRSTNWAIGVFKEWQSHF